MSRIVRGVAAVCLAAGGALAPAAGAGAQSLLDRPPDLNGGWVGSRGQVYFNFVHRFVSSDAPERKVSNAPNFTLAAGLPFRALLGVNYATNSTLAPRYPNEWEFFLRHALLQQDAGLPLDVSAQVAYNLASDGLDGELSLGRRLGPLRLVASGRVLADAFDEGELRFAVGGGGTLRISRFVALAGDVATLLEPREEDGDQPEERVAWGAGLHIAIPSTPHTFSLQAANTNN
ncbi:MAG TPA: hypothetical protein VFX98_17575, partial [Longimicrobiaceae bacterium]|nr:hypothetical protein [Longimicrobiaceae bacterium]